MSHRHCKRCYTGVVYSDKWDAFYCPVCNEWREPKCGFVSCDVCKDRPSRPLPDEPTPPEKSSL